MNDKSQHANPNKSRTPRHRAREFALQGLYQWIMSREDAAVVVEHIRTAHGFEKADTEHFEGLMYGSIKQAPVLREQITPLIDRTLDELSPIEHAVLLLGAFELIH
ncbi:MAG: hypothetical protein RL748_4483, partial [Pseudomonadota bacterium]